MNYNSRLMGADGTASRGEMGGETCGSCAGHPSSLKMVLTEVWLDKGDNINGV